MARKSQSAPRKLLEESAETREFIDHLLRYLANSHRQEVAAGTRLFSEGETAESVFIVLSGRIQAFVASSRKKVLLRTAGPGSVLGLPFAIGCAKFEVSAEAVQPSTIVTVAREDLLEFLRAHPEHNFQAVLLLGTELFDLSTKAARPLHLKSRGASSRT